MNLQQRKKLLEQLRLYMQSQDADWVEAKHRARGENGWFVPEFVELACQRITSNYLDKEQLVKWAAHYHIDDNIAPKTVGVVMAGNIPLVGFHDFLAVFISGHRQLIKPSSKDAVLIKHLVKKMHEWDAGTEAIVQIAEQLKDCDAYIATGSNNSSRYFEQYFGKYPNIIRRNKTSVAVLTGNETDAQLAALCDDIHQYFGLGCRSVSKIFVPPHFDFERLLRFFKAYDWFELNHKYKNNFDYQLSIALLNNQPYMTDGRTLLTESAQLFSPISHLFYERYSDAEALENLLKHHPDLQCIIGEGHIPFGMAQEPGLFSYADDVDTMAFFLSL